MPTQRKSLPKELSRLLPLVAAAAWLLLVGDFCCSRARKRPVLPSDLARPPLAAGEKRRSVGPFATITQQPPDGPPCAPLRGVIQCLSRVTLSICAAAGGANGRRYSCGVVAAQGILRRLLSKQTANAGHASPAVLLLLAT